MAALTPNRAEWGDPGAKSGLVVKWRVISSVDPSGTRLQPTRPYGVSGDLAKLESQPARHWWSTQRFPSARPTLSD